MDALHAFISTETSHAPSIDAQACVSFAHHRFGAQTVGVLLYGSSLRAPTDDTLLDIYVLVDNPRVALRHFISGLAAELLPPNVYLIEVPVGARTIRAKMAVISLAKFEACATAFASQIWGRFAQPAIIAYARDDNARRRIVAALTTCTRTFIDRTRALITTPCAVETLWVRGLQECYAAELRPEHGHRAHDVVADNMPYYEKATRALLKVDAGGGIPPITDNAAGARFEWWVRRRWGKTLNLMRLMKAAFTFAGGLDYAVAKIAKHTGIKIPVSERDRRHPLLAGIRVYLEARRRGGVR